MEYFRTEEGQIYADMAYRLGKVLVQYENMKTNEMKFEITLYLAVLQNLLANCQELIVSMQRSDRKKSILNKKIKEGVWGISGSNWIENTFNEEDTLGNFITRLRNSMSHPSSEIKKNNKDIQQATWESTGYRTQYTGENNTQEEIKKIIFINSKDVRNGKLTNYTEDKILSFINKKDEKLPQGISYRKLENERCIFTFEGKDFARISRIEMTVNELRKFTLELVNLLAQPINPDWDGFSNENIIGFAA